MLFIPCVCSRFYRMIIYKTMCTFGLFLLLLHTAAGDFIGSSGAQLNGIQRHPRSLDACLGYFDIKKSHVVHVGKSEALGGRLLNSTAGLSVNDCLQKCCQTEQCTVASYERQVQTDSAFASIFKSSGIVGTGQLLLVRLR